jgi:hypothetical protein
VILGLSPPPPVSASAAAGAAVKAVSVSDQCEGIKADVESAVNLKIKLGSGPINRIPKASLV